VTKTCDPQSTYLGSDGSKGSNRNVFGQTVAKIMSGMSDEQKKNVLCIDSDLEGSVGFKHIRAAHPEMYLKSGIMERGNFSACAGFGMKKGRQGIFATFAAFLEMCTSEITMARLNRSNVLCHFSHSGCDDMADNTCHFGLNNLFADNGLEDHYETKLYFPCDANQMDKVVRRVFFDHGMRFVFSIRSKLPLILNDQGTPFYGDGYKFVPGKDELIRDGKDGFVVSFGDAIYRSLDAVERLKKDKGLSVGLVNKPTLNVVDEDMMKKIGSAKFVLIVEPLSRRTGLGSKFGTWLLERGLSPKFARIGVHREGCGGLWEQAYHQGYDSKSIQKKILELA
jgi:transketolase C-terminal domain/subunit